MRVVGRNLPPARYVGLAATVLLTLSSFGGGALRERGGLLEKAGFGFLTYGHGAVFSNVGMFTGLILLPLAWILLGAEVFTARRNGSAAAAVSRSLTCTIAMWTIALIPAAPMLSRDVYSYLVQGQLMANGLDPYSVGASAVPGPILLEVSPDWRNTTTPYGPLHLWLAEKIVAISGGNITLGCLLFKLLSVLGFAAVVLTVPLIADKLGGSRLLALWLGPANPVMLLHLVAGMHNESVMVGLVSIAVWLAVNRRFAPAALLIGVALAVKATAVIALPFMVWMFSTHLTGRFASRALAKAEKRRTTALEGQDGTSSRTVVITDRQRRREEKLSRLIKSSRTSTSAFVLAGSILTVLSALPVAAIAWLSGAGWGWVAELSGNTKVINPLSLPTLVANLAMPILGIAETGLTFNEVVAFTRLFGSVLLLAGLVWCWWRFRRGTLANVRGTVAAYLVAVTFNAVAFPWYYASILGLVGCIRPSRRIRWWTVFLSLVVAVSFTGSGNHQLYNAIWMVPTLLTAWVLTDWVTPIIDRGLAVGNGPATQTAATTTTPATQQS